MGIDNIEILLTPDLDYRDARQQEIAAKIAVEQELVDAHRRGEHSLDRMVRVCPLCPES